MRTLRQMWNDGDNVVGGWLSIPATLSAEVMARAGFDYVCVDTQHGTVEYQITVELIRAIEHGGSIPIVRVPWNEPGIIGKMLDAGAEGVIIPMVNTPEEAEAAVKACRYAPEGSRSFGPTIGRIRRPDYVEWARENVAVIPMIETLEAVENLPDILEVPGIDAVYVGPADLSLTLGLPPANNDGTPAFDEAYATIISECQKAGVMPGCHATGPLVPKRFEQGMRMVTAIADQLALGDGARASLAAARGETTEGGGGSLY
ncbi:MAG: aldolase/citrate lyase family protein [Actinomycetota bacterium]